MSNKDLFIRYEELKAVIAEAETELEAIKPQLISLIPEGKDVKGTNGIFTLQSRAKWKYSKEHDAQADALKELEEQEKAKGIAKATYSPVLYYTTKK